MRVRAGAALKGSAELPPRSGAAQPGCCASAVQLTAFASGGALPPCVVLMFFRNSRLSSRPQTEQAFLACSQAPRSPTSAASCPKQDPRPSFCGPRPREQGPRPKLVELSRGRSGRRRRGQESGGGVGSEAGTLAHVMSFQARRAL